MKNILKRNKLLLLYARDRQVLCYSSQAASPEWSLEDWSVSGDWHKMTIVTNDDKSSGLDGGLAVDCIGSWESGIIQKEVELLNFGEILFEYYVQNGQNDKAGESNQLIFRIDGETKLEISGPSPWQRCAPIGIPPGKHTLSFEYRFEGVPNLKKAVVDTLVVWEAKNVNCLISKAAPPKPSRNIGNSATLRGFTRYQEMTDSDTEAVFTAVFNAYDFLEFMQKSGFTFYYVDEFGICYRGIFPSTVNPKNIAMNALYSVELVLIAAQKTGIGFCRF